MAISMIGAGAALSPCDLYHNERERIRRTEEVGYADIQRYFDFVEHDPININVDAIELPETWGGQDLDAIVDIHIGEPGGEIFSLGDMTYDQLCNHGNDIDNYTLRYTMRDAIKFVASYCNNSDRASLMFVNDGPHTGNLAFDFFRRLTEEQVPTPDELPEGPQFGGGVFDNPGSVSAAPNRTWLGAILNLLQRENQIAVYGHPGGMHNFWVIP